MIAVANPTIVVINAMYIPFASAPVSELIPNDLNVIQIPITVPMSPKNGASSIMVFSVLSPLVILLNSTMKICSIPSSTSVLFLYPIFKASDMILETGFLYWLIDFKASIDPPLFIAVVTVPIIFVVSDLLILLK
ncbi:hypothetical protein ALNOE001_15530 [Candidatus Methanobinarius endosymbioticus]|uniref:Uncharacterized protein n=1 Tax=Candidatus Methanobinarius endosymbioticus TaxID=2006182 RepID=A0A366M956_9EURY|nr:hypothetical protein ALNOE001_15530 [Candidatus Methanobinarius endosymbioticus]